MSKKLSTQERLIRIELARTRAALERQNVIRSLHDVQDSLTPAGLWHSLFSGVRLRRSRRGVNWLSQLVGVSRRYPFLLSGASAVLSTLGRGRRGLVWRVALGALAGWKIFQGMQHRDSKGDSPATRLPRSS